MARPKCLPNKATTRYLTEALGRLHLVADELSEIVPPQKASLLPIALARDLHITHMAAAYRELNSVVALVTRALQVKS